VPGAPSASFEGETFYFCGAGCKAAFEAQHAVSE
jgi:YHS domain-containing protein